MGIKGNFILKKLAEKYGDQTTADALSRLEKDKRISVGDLRSTRYTADRNENMKTEAENEAEENNIKMNRGANYYNSDQVNESVRRGDLRSADDLDAVNIQSTAIKHVDYNPKNENLKITFQGDDNKGYDFPNVPKEEVQNFLEAPSKGKYYHKHIKQYSTNQ